MKIDADEKESAESVERGEWKSAAAASGNRSLASAKATFRKDRRLKHPAVEQGPRGDREAGACGGLAVPDAIAICCTVRRQAAQRDLDKRIVEPKQRSGATNPATPRSPTDAPEARPARARPGQLSD